MILKNSPTTSISEPNASEKTALDTVPHSSPPIHIPELLAPAGDWDCARAAVENGADAIYFGLERFNARMRAHNFTEVDLPKLMEFLHRRGVKGYVTFNTLVFANEMAEAEQYLRAIIAAGVDAAIVQDIGICRLIRELSPDFPIHASTQMTITSAAGAHFARDLGCSLVVLARECSLTEIEKIQSAPPSPGFNFQDSNSPPAQAAGNFKPNASNLKLPLEVFVHGALCVAYSGQCLTSEALGGRSANRGECAQACRMPYDLIADGEQVPLGDRRYLLSPQDLSGLEVLPELIRLGVASLKIEGRLKTPEYVANITRVYRKALDRICAGSGRTRSTSSRESSSADNKMPAAFISSEKKIKDDVELVPPGLVKQIRAESRYDLEMAFSRGLYTGWFRGINNQELAHARFGKKRGVYLGEVNRIQGEKIIIRLEAPLKPGDGVVFDAGHPDQDEEGGRVYTVETRHQETFIGFGHGDLDFDCIQPGDKLWKTSDPELDRRLRQSFAGDRPHFQRPLKLEIHGRAGQPMIVISRDEQGHVVQVSSVMPLAPARKQPLTTERLREQLGRLGGTAFCLGELSNLLEGEVMLPVSELNRLRREAVDQLAALRAQPTRWTLNQNSVKASSTASPASSEKAAIELGCSFRENSRDEAKLVYPDLAELIVLVRNPAQLDAALRCGVRTLYCEFADPKKYREAVRTAHESFGCADGQRTIWVAPPRIFKMGEEWILDQVRSCNADGYLVRNHDHLQFFADSRRIGDFSLNVANALTAGYFINRFGLERVTASYDLNLAQLEALLRSAPPEWFEITIHQHMPMFHMEHCVFCAFLSKGTDYTNCGRPCDQHEVKLRDRVGAEHPLKADVGCRNTVFNALAQTGAENVARMLALGARKFRIEFLNETPQTVTQTITMYRQLLRGEIAGTQVWRELKLLNQLGVTRGQLEKF